MFALRCNNLSDIVCMYGIFIQCFRFNSEAVLCDIENLKNGCICAFSISNGSAVSHLCMESVNCM
jgi:hypothetical protein